MIHIDQKSNQNIKSMLKYILIVFTLFTALDSFGQDEQKFKQKFIDAEFDLLYEDYSRALLKYLSVYRMDTTNSNVCYRIGLCYFNMFEKEKAIPYLEKASVNTTSNYKEGSYKERMAPIDAMLMLGRVYLIAGRLDNAKSAFNNYRNEIAVEDIAGLEIADLELAKCSAAKRMTEKPLPIEIINMGTQFNDDEHNWHVVVSQNMSSMVYSSISKGRENIFYSSMQSDSTWSAPKSISNQLNSTGYYKPVWLSHDGNKLILYSGDTESGDLFISKKNGTKWTPMEPFSKVINSKYRETGACLTPNNRILVFASDRPGGFGGLDLWAAFRDSDGEWGEPINMGPVINTKYDETSPYLIDGNTLYFSSQSHFNIGGFDIFYSKMLKEGWTKPINLGYPINTMEDDVFFAPVKRGTEAYMSRHEGSKGYGKLDLYKLVIGELQETEVIDENMLAVVVDSASFANTIKDTTHLVSENNSATNLAVVTENQVDTNNAVIAENRTETATNNSGQETETTSDNSGQDTEANADNSGQVAEATNNNSGQNNSARKSATFIEVKGFIKLEDKAEMPSDIRIEVRDYNTNSLLANLKPDFAEGKYSFRIPPGSYNILFTGEKYKTMSEAIVIPDSYNLPEVILNSSLTPKSVSSGEHYSITNIFFEFDSPELTREAMTDLEKIYRLMDENGSLSLELYGYTDSQGDLEYNRKLSEKRAQNAQKYLAGKGVDINKIRINAYGASNFIASNADENSRKQNRRVELKLVKGGDEVITANSIENRTSNTTAPGDGPCVVLFAKSDKELPSDYFNKYSNKSLKSSNKYNVKNGFIYTSEQFGKKSEALKLLNALVEEGLSDVQILSIAELQKMSGSYDLGDEISDDLYTIQVKASRSPINKERFSNLGTIVEYVCSDSYYRYAYGDFLGFTAAKRELNDIQAKGYNDAYIVPVKRLRARSVSASRKEKKETGTVDTPIATETPASDNSETYWSIQVGAAKSPMDMKKFTSLGRVDMHIGKDGFYRYSYGKFEDIGKAGKNLENVRSKGFHDAFIVTSDRYKNL